MSDHHSNQDRLLANIASLEILANIAALEGGGYGDFKACLSETVLIFIRQGFILTPKDLEYLATIIQYNQEAELSGDLPRMEICLNLVVALYQRLAKKGGGA